MKRNDWTPIERSIDRLETALAQLDERVEARDVLQAMIAVNRMLGYLQALAPDLVEQGVYEGLSQRTMATALGVPESTLRGSKAAFA